MHYKSEGRAFIFHIVFSQVNLMVSNLFDLSLSKKLKLVTFSYVYEQNDCFDLAVLALLVQRRPIQAFSHAPRMVVR